MFFESVLNDGMTLPAVAICTGVSLAVGVFIAVVYRLKARASKNMVVTLIMLPAIVQAVIMMVNGNIGTGVAVMGAFSLVRFRSFPGSAKDICFIFFAMAAGLAAGIGQVVFAAAFSLVLGAAFLALKFFTGYGGGGDCRDRRLKVTFPETADFETGTAAVLRQYAQVFEIVKIRTSNLGSLFTVDYSVRLKSNVSEKQMIDGIRVINGNLPIVCLSGRASEEEL